jgi:hypothetical protein
MAAHFPNLYLMTDIRESYPYLSPHHGKSVQQMILQQPRYTWHVLTTRAFCALDKEIDAIGPALIEAFNALPTVAGCWHDGCGRKPVHLHVYEPSGHICLCCEEHGPEPILDGNSYASLQAEPEISWEDILEPRLPFGTLSDKYYRTAIRELAESKGLRKGPLTAKRAAEFFASATPSFPTK